MDLFIEETVGVNTSGKNLVQAEMHNTGWRRGRQEERCELQAGIGEAKTGGRVVKAYERLTLSWWIRA
jgi:hypothetical protein